VNVANNAIVGLICADVGDEGAIYPYEA